MAEADIIRLLRPEETLVFALYTLFLHQTRENTFVRDPPNVMCIPHLVPEIWGVKVWYPLLPKTSIFMVYCKNGLA